MNEISVFFDSVYGVIRSFGIADFVDIVLLSFFIYKAIKLVQETRAEQLVKGLLLLGASYLVAVLFNLRAMNALRQNVFTVGILALVVLFQPELRRILEKVGRTQVQALSVFGPDDDERHKILWERTLVQICDAVSILSKEQTGALIVIERKTKLGEPIATGIELNATVSAELLLNIFFVNTPLHDGAVIIRNGKVLAAACFLPKPQKEELIATKLGSRHRAAIGISEISDSVTVVVSEENGIISVAENGDLIRDFSKETLMAYLEDKLLPEKKAEPLVKKRRRAKKS